MMYATSAPFGAVAIRGRLVDTLRRDLIGPRPQDADIARELLKSNPSRWYLAGFLAPALEDIQDGVENIEDEGDPHFGDEPADPETGTGGGAQQMMRRTTNLRHARAACHPHVASPS